MLNHENLIDESFLFFSVPEIKKIIPKEKYKSLLDLEMWDWLSSIYWGENLGIQYSLKMTELSKNEIEKKTWLKIYCDEIDHQQRLSNWFLLNNTYPLPPSLLMKKIQLIVDRGRKAKSFEEYSKVIEKGQILLEETGAAIMKWRCQNIKDRSLKSIIYKIQKDEASHIITGKKKMSELTDYSKTRTENMLDNAEKLFPFHLAKKLLNNEEYNQIKKLSKEVLNNKFQEVLSSKGFKPIPLISTFEKVEGYECFGCKPSRSEGLLLEPKIDGNIVFDEIVFNNFFVGMNGLVHGGFLSMALDEIMGYAITLGKEKLSLTTSLKVQFLKPVKCNKKYLLKSFITDDSTNEVIKTYGEIIDVETGKVCVSASADFFILTSGVCSKIFPGIFNNPSLAHMYS